MKNVKKPIAIFTLISTVLCTLTIGVEPIMAASNTNTQTGYVDIPLDGHIEASFQVGVPTSITLQNGDGGAYSEYIISVSGELGPEQQLQVKPQDNIKITRAGTDEELNLQVFNADNVTEQPKSEFNYDDLSSNSTNEIRVLLKSDEAMSTGDYSGILRYEISLKWLSDYTIKLNSNGGSGTMDNIAAEVNETISIPDSTFTKDKAIFKNWNTKADGSGKSYSAGDSVSNISDGYKTVTLYAQWINAPEPGSTVYHMGGYDWQCVAYDDITKAVTMQSLGMTSGSWPGYTLTGPYDNAGAWGSPGFKYIDISNKNIANYNSTTIKFYETDDWKSVCADTSKGLYLVSDTNANGIFRDALNRATSVSSVWLGNATSGSYAFMYHYSRGAFVNDGQGQNVGCGVAPAFDIDLTKVLIDESNNITMIQ